MTERRNIRKGQSDANMLPSSSERRKRIEFDTRQGMNQDKTTRTDRTKKSLESIKEKVPWLFKGANLDNNHDVQQILKIGLQEKLTERWLNVQSQLSNENNAQFLKDSRQVNSALAESAGHFEKGDDEKASQALDKAKEYLLKMRDYLPRESEN